MKKYGGKILYIFVVVALFAALTFSGCAKSENALLSEFNTLFEAGVTRESLAEAAAFLERHAGDLSAVGASRLVLAYESHALRFLEEGGADLFDEVTDREPIDRWLDGTYMILTQSGQVVLDYVALLESFGTVISEELNALLTLKMFDAADELDQTNDEESMQSHETLTERAIKAEQILQSYTNDDVMRANTLDYYRDYLFLILAGSDSLPVFDRDTGEFLNEARTAYEQVMVEHPDSVLAEVLFEYFTYLHSIGFRIDYSDAVENKIFFDTCDYLIGFAMERL